MQRRTSGLITSRCNCSRTGIRAGCPRCEKSAQRQPSCSERRATRELYSSCCVARESIHLVVTRLRQNLQINGRYNRTTRHKSTAIGDYTGIAHRRWDVRQPHEHAGPESRLDSNRRRTCRLMRMVPWRSHRGNHWPRKIFDRLFCEILPYTG